MKLATQIQKFEKFEAENQKTLFPEQLFTDHMVVIRMQYKMILALRLATKNYLKALQEFADKGMPAEHFALKKVETRLLECLIKNDPHTIEIDNGKMPGTDE